MEKNQMKKKDEVNLRRRTNILLGILNGPLSLLMLRENMMLAISSMSVGWMMKFMGKFKVLLCSISNRSKIVVQGVSNYSNRWLVIVFSPWQSVLSTVDKIFIAVL